MEDDIIIKEKYIDLYFDKIQNIKNWDVIYSIRAWKKKKINKFISKAYKIKTTGMYIVNKHYYDTLLNNFKYSVNYMEKCKKNKKNKLQNMGY